MILVNTETISGTELEMLDSARALATRRMVEEAEKMGAHGVVKIR